MSDEGKTQEGTEQRLDSLPGFKVTDNNVDGVVIHEKKEEPKPLGRPTDYTHELADEICSQVAEGRSLRSVLRQEGMPAMSAVFRWIATHEYFKEQYTRAKEESADALVDDMLDLADSTDTTDPAAVNKARLQVDTRKWVASKLKPKKYGDKIDHTTNGKDLPTPILGHLPTDNTKSDVIDLT